MAKARHLGLPDPLSRPLVLVCALRLGVCVFTSPFTTNLSRVAQLRKHTRVLCTPSTPDSSSRELRAANLTSKHNTTTPAMVGIRHMQRWPDSRGRELHIARPTRGPPPADTGQLAFPHASPATLSPLSGPELAASSHTLISVPSQKYGRIAHLSLKCCARARRHRCCTVGHLDPSRRSSHGFRLGIAPHCACWSSCICRIDCSSWRSIVCECTCSAARLLSPPG